MSFKFAGHIGRSALCEVCRAGSVISFNWTLEPSDAAQFGIAARSVFVSPEPLRRGTLYRCGTCARFWHLDDAKAMMTHVLDDRVPLIRRWNERPISLRRDILRQLDRIGYTPPDFYGNGREYQETPCGVVTVSGERIDAAMVSFQRGAPVEHGRNCRLGSEVESVYPSPFALPRRVRVAASKAKEAGMGFAPTLVEAPGGQLFVLNGRVDFLIRQDCRAGDIRLSRRRLDRSQMPEIINRPEDIPYFIADA